MPQIYVVSELIEFPVQITGTQDSLLPNDVMQSEPETMFGTIVNSCLSLCAKACGRGEEVCTFGKSGVKSRLNEEKTRGYIEGETRSLY